MPYEVEVDEENAIVVVRVWGSATRGDHLAARNEAAKLCDKFKLKKLMIDLQDLKTGKGISMIGCFRFGESLTQGLLPNDIRIAHVMPADKKAYQAVEFAATVAQNRGGAVKDFATSSDAKQWLVTEP